MRIMISCGEASGDLYAGALAAALRARAPEVEIAGFGGPRLAAAGASLTGEYSGLTVTGLVEAMRVLPRSYAMLRRLVAVARARRPDVFVAIDFPDFNFRLMAALGRLGIPIVYYVSPQLWAWRPGRLKTMRRLVDRVLVIFPFETGIYERAGVPVQFVGHPLVDVARASRPRGLFLRGLGLQPDLPTVALLPGSRPNELRRIAPAMAAAVPRIRAAVPSAQFVVARAPNLGDELFASLAGCVVVRDATDDVLAAADLVITASGTATVQAVLHERPMVVVYRVSPLSYRIGKPFLTVDSYAMPNLVAGHRIVPELIQDECTPDRIAAEAIALLTEPDRYTRMREAVSALRQRFGAPGASARAADAILQVASRAPGGASSA